MASGDELFEGGPVRVGRSGGGDVNGGGGTGEPIDPVALAGGEPDDGDDSFARNDDGTVKRNKDGSPRRKRGRKSGGSNASRKATNPHDLKASIDALTNMLALSHQGIAIIANVPEMALNADEARLLATATVPVLEQFDFKPDPRFTAVFGLVMVAGQIYVPRAVLIRMRRSEERARRAKPVYDSQNTATRAGHNNDAFEGQSFGGFPGAVN